LPIHSTEFWPSGQSGQGWLGMVLSGTKGGSEI